MEAELPRGPARQIVDEWLRPFDASHCKLILKAAPNHDDLLDDNVVARPAEIGRL